MPEQTPNVVDLAKRLREKRLAHAWIVLGATPGPGIDIRIQPRTKMVFALEPLTKAGETFVMLFYPARMVGGGQRLAMFRIHCQEFELTFDTTWIQEAL